MNEFETVSLLVVNEMKIISGNIRLVANNLKLYQFLIPESHKINSKSSFLIAIHIILYIIVLSI